jgi:transcription initiation factor IIE alpha subunit
MVTVKELLREAVRNGEITCPKCGSKLEPDAERCSCGWENLLVIYGFI